MNDSAERQHATSPHAKALSPEAVHEAFDPARLTQARQLAGLTKKRLSDLIGVTAAAVGQYEAGTKPRPELIPALANALDVPMAFFVAGRPHARLDTSMAHFRHLRSTRMYQRAKAIAYVEQAWELTFALEKRVQFPAVNLPGFAGGEVASGVDLPSDPVAAAHALRQYWNLGDGPITHLVRRMESHGIVVLTPPRDEDAETVDAYSTARLPRPIVVLTPNRANDVYRHRFTAAHELGHLVLHGEATPGDHNQEREADKFAAEFLTPRLSIMPDLPKRVDFRKLAELRRVWGVSVDSLLYRCREVGLLSDSAASRAYQRLHSLRTEEGFKPEPLEWYPGEQPSLLAQAFDLACDHGLSITKLADQLAWNVPRVREFLGVPDTRPVLRVMR